MSTTFILGFIGLQFVAQVVAVYYCYATYRLGIYPSYTFLLLAVGYLFRASQTFLILFLRGTIGQSYTVYNGNILLTSWFWGGLASILGFIGITRFYYYSRSRLYGK